MEFTVAEPKAPRALAERLNPHGHFCFLSDLEGCTCGAISRRERDAATIASDPEIRGLVEAAAKMLEDPSDKYYPRVDCYASGDERQDAKAPMWTEAGLYGRFGKEAARTLLARHRKLKAALAGWTEE